MTNKKTTKRALITSALSVLLCISMLVGSTFAWFTDSATTSVNRIQSGTLDVALEMLVNDEWVSAEGETLNFIAKDGNENILWEPGCTYELPKLRVVNKGNLALKFDIVVSGIDGDAKLNEVIDWTFSYESGEGVSYYDYTAESGIIYGLSAGGNLPFTISGHMQETAGNEYQNLTIDGISITVYATQLPEEYDSTTNLYDKDAGLVDQWDGTVSVVPAEEDGVIVINTAEEFAAFAASVNSGNTYEGKTVKLNINIDLANLTWTAISNFAGTFDGQGYTILNLKDAALFTTITENGIVKNLTLANPSAAFNSRNGIGFLAKTLEGKAENCTVTNASIVNTAYLSYAGGMFAEAKNNAVIDECAVDGVTIIASNANDAGQHVGGLIGSTSGSAETCVTITNSSASNVTIEAGKKTKRFGGFIGYSNNTTIENCTVNNVNITVDDYYYRTAGFIAEATNGTVIKNCAVNGATIDVTKVTSGGTVGGFAASVLIVNDDRTITFENCTVSGLSLTLNADNTSGAGGFIGATGSYATAIKNCSVEGEINTTTEAIAAGAVKELVGSGTPTVEGNTTNVTIK